MASVGTKRPQPKFLRLPDGRALAYEDVGPPGAPPIMHFHGIPSSRLEVLWEAASCASLGCRVICPDRPGIGLSDYLPGRSLLDWPADAAALADSLGLDSFGVMGVSGGGPYALACAYLIPDRLTGLALVSSLGRLDRDGAVDGLGTMHRAAFRHVRDRPWITELVLRSGTAGLAAVVQLVQQSGTIDDARVNNLLLNLQPCSSDLDAMKQAAPEILSFEFARESGRRGWDGVRQDARVLGGPWGFELAGVTTPVRLWHGDSDPTVPLAHGEALAAELPDSRLQVCPEEGHLLFAAHLEEILAAATGA